MNNNISPQTQKEMKKNLFILIVLLGNLGFIQAQSHFSPVWGGNGVDHMNFYVMPSTINGTPLEAGDEVAVFDEGYCVGAGVFDGTYDIRVNASRNDSETGVNGYTPGHDYYFRIWDASRQIEVSNVNLILEGGSSTFDIGLSAYVTLEGTVACDAPAAPSVSSVDQPDCSDATGTVELSGLPASGTWTLTRTPGNVQTTGAGATTNISGLSEGIYSWTVTDASACTSSSSAEVTIGEQPETPSQPAIGTITQPSCTISTGSVVLNGLPSSGTWTLTRSPGGVVSTGTGTSTTVSGLGEGAYTWIVRNGEGCISASSSEAEINEQPSVPVAPAVGPITQPTCEISTGSVVLNGLPASGTWTLRRSPGSVSSTGTGTSATISGLSEGSYTWTVSNGAGCTSGLSEAAVINAASGTPEQPGSITGNTSPCAGTSGLTYNVTNVSGVSYNWSVPSGWSITGGQGSNSVSVTAGSAAGSITVTPSNSCGNGTARTLTVSINTIPAQPGVISGNTSPCSGTTGLIYSVTNSSGVLYEWTFPSGWSVTAGQETNSVTATAGSEGGNIIVSPSNSCGNGTSRSVTVTTGSTPAQPGNITGNVSPCQGTTGLSYSVPGISGLTYNWTVPSGWSITDGQGTNYVTVTAGTAGGNMTVTPSNSCGNGTARSLAVGINAYPGQPAAISGNTSPCPGVSSLTYSVTNVTGVTYNWTVPSGWSVTSGQGTNSVTVTPGSEGGNIIVTPSNSCGNGTARSLTVAIGTVPAQPGAITGNTNPCPGTAGLIYSVTNVPGVAYEWSFPSGWSVTAGRETNSVTVTAGSVGGNITVSPSNSCGNGTSRSVTVTTGSTPAQPGIMTGNASPCQGTTGLNYSVPAVSGVAYNWAVPSGWSITAGQGTNSVTVTAGTAGGNMTVTPSNSCGNGTSRSFSVTPGLVPDRPGVVAGNATVCRGNSLTYSIDPVSNANSYTWILPSGWTGTSTSTSIAAVAGSSGEISVRANNGCGSGASRTINITVNNIPEQPSAISGSQSICPGSSQNYSISDVLCASTYIWTLPSGWTGSSTINSINLTAGANGGAISVAARNTCGTSTARTINVSTARPSAPVTSTKTDPNCSVETGSVVLNSLPGSGTWSITRLPGGQTYSGSGTSYTITGLHAGTYTFRVSNSSGCSSDESTGVTISAAPESPGRPSAENIIQPSCTVASGSVTLTGLPASGMWTLTRQPGGSTFTGSGTSRTITGLACATTYNFSVTNAAGCTSARCSDVIINAVPQTPTAPVIGAITHQGCSAPGSVRLNGLPSAGTWTLTRTPGAIITTGTGTEVLINNLYPGTYTFTITNASQCTSAASGKATVNSGPGIPDAPSIDTIINPTCDLATGSIGLKNLPETESWILTMYPDAVIISGNKADTIISGLNTGDYSFMVTNSSGCNSTITDMVPVATQPPSPKAPVIGSILQPTCSTATGSVELTGLPFGTWNLKGISGEMDTVSTGTGTNIIISMLPAGTYVFEVTNSEGCVSDASENAVVDEQPEIPESPVITFSNNVLHSGSADGNQWYTPDGPIDGAVNQDYVITASGEYFVMVTNGICTSEPSDTLQVTLTGIPDTELSKSVMIYPNPVKTELTIEIENGKTVTNFEIINALGQTVHSGVVLHQTVIDVTKFRCGIYLIRLFNDKKSIYFKVVKD